MAGGHSTAAAEAAGTRALAINAGKLEKRGIGQTAERGQKFGHVTCKSGKRDCGNTTVNGPGVKVQPIRRSSPKDEPRRALAQNEALREVARQPLNTQLEPGSVAEHGDQITEQSAAKDAAARGKPLDVVLRNSGLPVAATLPQIADADRAQETVDQRAHNVLRARRALAAASPADKAAHQEELDQEVAKLTDDVEHRNSESTQAKASLAVDATGAGALAKSVATGLARGATKVLGKDAAENTAAQTARTRARNAAPPPAPVVSPRVAAPINPGPRSLGGVPLRDARKETGPQREQPDNAASSGQPRYER
ncbi:MAG: hypothetical protein M3443_07095 [Actinomycetota bacterium]|nr:hypothetical protein [Actinomycetota bacterium]